MENGGAGNRTPVRKAGSSGDYERILCFDLAAGSLTGRLPFGQFVFTPPPFTNLEAGESWL